MSSKFVSVELQDLKFPRILFLIHFVFEYSFMQGSRYLLFGL